MASTDISQLIPVDLALPDGTAVSLRPLAAADRDELAVGFQRLSTESRYRRFMSPTPRLSTRELAYFSELDYRDHFAWGIQVVKEEGLDGAGVARYVRLSDEPSDADTAFTVLDEYQGRGLGQVLFRALAVAGWANEVRRFHFDVLADNTPMLKVLEKFGVSLDPVSRGITHGVLDLGPFVEELGSWPPADALAALATTAREAIQGA